MIQTTGLTRRALLRSTAASGLLLAFDLPQAMAQTQVPGDAPKSARLGAFIRIDADNRVTLVAPCTEMGQGSHTALAMILAGELGADWALVSVEAPPLAVAFRTPGRPIQSTSGSQMVRRWHEPLRKAAAAAREMLTTAAAQQWAVAVQSCTVRDGHVLHEGSNRKLPFGALAAAAARLPQPQQPVPRKTSGLVGTSVPRVDIPAKVDGSARFGIDVRLPGMVYAAIRQSPVFGARLLSVDEKGVRARRGVIDVVKLPDAVVVVADNFWRAKNAVAALEPMFSTPPAARVSTAQIAASQRLQLESPISATALDSGDAETAMAKAARKLQADYSVPFLHHATMEPMTCTVRLADGRCEVWVPSQNLTGAADTAARATGTPLDRVSVHATLLGGGFGRKFEQDFVEQAALVAKAVQRPVQLVWSREEDVQHGFYRPAMTARLSGAVDAQGEIQALVMRLVGPSVLEHTLGTPLIKGVDPVALIGISSEAPGAPGLLQQYTVPNFRTEFIYQPTHVPVGYWRSVGASENAFFVESFIDELAAQAKMDPFQYRRRLLRGNPRALAVLDKAATEAGWHRPPAAGRHRGFAFADCVGSLTAQVVELSWTANRLKIHRVTCAIDCGQAIHPDGVKAQVQGAILMGLSAALAEQVTVEAGRCVESNFHDYPILRLKDAPAVDVHIVDSNGPLGGVGEAGVPALAPALCGALFAATGRRIRSLPLSRHGFRTA